MANFTQENYDAARGVPTAELIEDLLETLEDMKGCRYVLKNFEVEDIQEFLPTAFWRLRRNCLAKHLILGELKRRGVDIKVYKTGGA